MQDTRTFWLGFVANSDGAYCICGESLEHERRREIGVCMDDGSGRRRLICADCGGRYAPHLQSLVQPAIYRLTHHYGERVPQKFVLVDVSDVESVEVIPDEVFAVEIPAELTTGPAY
jgi:hypothetical protein